MDPADIALASSSVCGAHRTVEEVLRHLSDCAGRFGLDHFILTRLPLPRQTLPPLVFLNGWPPDNVPEMRRRAGHAKAL